MEFVDPRGLAFVTASIEQPGGGVCKCVEYLQFLASSLPPRIRASLSTPPPRPNPDTAEKKELLIV